MLAAGLQTPNISTKRGEGNTTSTGYVDMEPNFEVPQPTIILLSVLAVSLIALSLMYFLLIRCQRQFLEKLVGRQTPNKTRLGTLDDEDGLMERDGLLDDEESMVTVSLPLEMERTQNAQSVYQKQHTLRAAAMRVSVTFSPKTGRLLIEIVRLESVAEKLLKSGLASAVEIHARLQPLPSKFRYKTSSKPITKAEFHERFAFDGFRKRDLRKCWFRFRLYSHRLLGRGILLGQVNVSPMDFETDEVWSTLSIDILPSEEVYKVLTRKS